MYALCVLYETLGENVSTHKKSPTFSFDHKDKCHYLLSWHLVDEGNHYSPIVNFSFISFALLSFKLTVHFRISSWISLPILQIIYTCTNAQSIHFVYNCNPGGGLSGGA